MTDKHYSVVFRGDIVLGKNVLDVKQKLKKLFNVDDARIDSLFVGKPVPLKSNISLDEAERYKTILHQAGIVVVVESPKKAEPVHKSTKADMPAEAKKSTSDASSNIDSISETEQWKLAPVGSLLADKKKKSEAEPVVDVNVDHLAVLPQEGNLLNDDERIAVSAPAVDMESLDWELTPYGESLLKDAERKKVIPAEVDTSELSLANVGVDLLQTGDKEAVQSVDINTDHIHLSPNENS